MSVTPSVDVFEGLTRACGRLFQDKPKNLARLTGGANMEIYAFTCGMRNLILRRYPNGVPPSVGEETLTLEDEASIIELAVRNGVKAPEVQGVLAPEDGLGMGFLMTREPGEALPHKLLRDEKFTPSLPKLTSQFAQELAKIHAIKVSKAGLELNYRSPADSVAAIKRTLQTLGTDIPVYAYTLRWLETHIPDPTQPCILHGDFRMGNVLIEPHGLSAVLDWELAHLGDPAEDLAWLCVPSWRFGRYDRPVGGVGEIEDLLAAYTAAGGGAIDPGRFKFWLVYGTLRWGMMTLMMLDMWREGIDTAMERALIGTRCSEVEIDLLLMLEGDVGPLQTDFNLPQFQPVSAEPEMAELVDAVAGWIKADIFARETGANLFQARVAANALSIVTREAVFGQQFRAQSAARLNALNMTRRQLCDGLSAGEIDLETKGILAHLRLSSLERLAVHQPRYAGFAVAQKAWGVKEA